MSPAAVVVIGVGNTGRRDDGVGPVVAAEVAADCPAGVRVVTCAVEPTAILDAWDGADLAVVIDAAGGEEVVAGRVRRSTIEEVAGSGALTSHDLNLAQTYELARVLGRAPRRVVVVSIDAADLGHGDGLSPVVAQAVPQAVAIVRAELAADAVQEALHQSP
jgi:hydrogenase maturation protease